MKTPRRQFVQSASAAVSAALWGALAVPQVPKHGMPTPPQPADSGQNVPENTNSKISARAILVQHEKEFRDTLRGLSERVNNLQQEVQQLPSNDIFSVKIFKQTGEIEHLARQLKGLAKG
jgi:hypothetical protein